MRHILLCGKRQVGKSTLVEKLTAGIGCPVYGFITKSLFKREDGFHEIYMMGAGRYEEPVLLAQCDTLHHNVNAEVFDTMGVRLVSEAKPDGIIVMDELGFMEQGADKFTSAVLSALDGDIPVLAACKSTHPDVEFLNQVRNHPNVDLYMVDEENRDALYEKLITKINGWKEQK